MKLNFERASKFLSRSPHVLAEHAFPFTFALIFVALVISLLVAYGTLSDSKDVVAQPSAARFSMQAFEAVVRQWSEFSKPQDVTPKNIFQAR